MRPPQRPAAAFKREIADASTMRNLSANPTTQELTLTFKSSNLPADLRGILFKEVNTHSAALQRVFSSFHFSRTDRR